MNIGIVGTGHMAHFLSNSWKDHYSISILGRNVNELSALKNHYQIDAYSLDYNPVKHFEVIVLAVSDKSITELAEKMKDHCSILIHTSGNYDQALPKAHFGSIWPIYSLVKTELPTHRKIPIALMASDKETLSVITKLSTSISDIVFAINENQKKFLHLSAVIANNFTNHLLCIVQKLAEEHQFSAEWLSPIVAQTMHRFLGKEKLEMLQTGPAIRNDAETMYRHEKLLENHPYWKAFYQSLSESIINFYAHPKQ